MPANRKGFTLMEWLVVLAVLGILVAVAVPVFTGFLADSRLRADQATLSLLNRATQNYGQTVSSGHPDVFQGLETDASRMDTLVEAGFLDRVAVPQVPGAAFRWETGKQQWVYEGSLPGEGTGERYVFSEMELDGFSRTGQWEARGDGFYSGFGQLFIENPRSSYVIESVAALGEGFFSGGLSGGYGIFFETTLDGSGRDTGYVLQLDRNYAGGEVVIRPREAGSESSPVLRMSHASHPDIIPADKDDPWWTEEHTVVIEVTDPGTQEGKKELRVSIDGEVLVESFEIQAVPDSAENHTGYRSWHAGTLYREMRIR